MPNRSKLKALEAKLKKPAATILSEAYNQHRTQTEVAKALGVGQATISTWLVQLDLQEKTILVPRERYERQERAG